MSKIATYPLADTPLQLSDRLIGTEAPRPTPSATPLATKNFSLGELLQLFSGNFPAATLQAVLDAGNIATQNITLTGTIDTTLIRPDNIEDTSGSQGLPFQFLSKGAVSINWVNLPVDNLQAVLDAGNTATQNINLVGNITSTRIIPGNIQDDTTGIGITGQFLSKTASGIRWVNAPTSTTPGLGDVLSVNNTAINNINLTGNVTATSFIKTGGTNLQYLMADGSVTTGGGAQNLQQVTDEGNETTNEIRITDSLNILYLYQDGSIGFQNSAGGYGNLRSDLLTNFVQWQLPDAYGTIALIEDIQTLTPGQNITIVSNAIAVDIPPIVNTSAILATTGDRPQGIAIDSSGNIYTANADSNNVSKITPSGVSSILGTTGNFPFSIAIDSSGNIYTANSLSNNVSKITPAGVSSILGTTGSGPQGITIDSSGNVYTANQGSNNVSKITPAGVSSIFATTGTAPVNIITDSLGNIYTANNGSNNVSKITPLGVSTILGTTGAGPRGIVIDSLGNVYTSNNTSNNVSKITPAGVSTILSTTPPGAFGITIDTLGNIYTCNTTAGNVSKITPSGVSTILGTTGLLPNGIVIDLLGNIYTNNASSDNVTKITVDNKRILAVDDNLNIIRVDGSGGITSVTATSPITSSGGATPDISTSMATNKLIGRSTAGTGVMEEITVGTGLTLSGGTLNASATGGGIPHATASGTDTYTATVTGVTAYNDADAYLIRFTNGNTSSATLNINSLGAIPLYRNNDGVLIGGDIISGGEMLCVYNSTTNRFQVIGTAPNSLFSYVTNDDSVTLTKGMPVYAFSGTGDRMTVKRANNTGDATSAQTVGLVLSTSIAANQKGLIMMQGLLDGLSILPTATWSDGDAVYLGATNGSITNIKPHAPNHLVYLGVVTTASNGAAGRMYVRVQNGYELQELHNVQAQSPSLNDTLWYDNTVSPAQWKTASIPTILGYTPTDLGLVQAMTQGLQNIF